MGKKIITFGHIEIEKQKFHHYKSTFFQKNVEIDNMLKSKKFPAGKKNYTTFNQLYGWWL